MKKQQLILYSLVPVGLVLLAGWSLATLSMRYTLAPESTMRIEGTSSVHDWACTVEQVQGWVDMDAAAVAVAKVEVTVPVEAIACKNKTMDKKVRKAFNVEAHPVIRYTFSAAEVQAGAEEGPVVLNTTGRLTMAGTARDLSMAVTGERLADGRLRFSGQVPLLMTDFGIKPPTALLGTLKTGDRVVVHFDVIAGAS